MTPFRDSSVIIHSCPTASCAARSSRATRSRARISSSVSPCASSFDFPSSRGLDDAGDDEAARRAQKMKEKEDKKKALAEKRAARDAARKAKKAGEGEGGDA